MITSIHPLVVLHAESEKYFEKYNIKYPRRTFLQPPD